MAQDREPHRAVGVWMLRIMPALALVLMIAETACTFDTSGVGVFGDVSPTQDRLAEAGAHADAGSPEMPGRSDFRGATADLTGSDHVVVPDLTLQDAAKPGDTLAADSLKSLGAACTAAAECASGFCVDLPDSNTDRVCCYTECPASEDEGCSSTGDKCVDD